MGNRWWWLGKPVLPREINCLHKELGYNARAILEAAGVKFLGIAKEDPEFLRVELPMGWRTVEFVVTLPSSLEELDYHFPPDDWFYHLVDDKKRPRAVISDNANIEELGNFNGDRFDMCLCTRFELEADGNPVEREWHRGNTVCGVLDCGRVIYSTPPIKIQSEEASNEASELAIAWLYQHYPDWKNPGAYWD